MARKTTDFYKAMTAAGLNFARTAELLEIEAGTIEAWKHSEPDPIYTRFLLIYDQKHINHQNWQGWIFSQGVLRYKNKRFSPNWLLAMQDESKRLYHAEYELKRLKSWRGVSILLQLLLSRYIKFSTSTLRT